MIGPSATFADVVQYAISLIDAAVPVLAVLALVLFFAGIVRYVAKAGDEKGKERDKEVMLWGLIALFVIFSIWGILRVLNNTLFGGGSSSGGDPWQGLREGDVDPWHGLR